jgi:UDP-N-acetylmuramate--alanine ligase
MYKEVHFIGIGGIGMSGIAQLYLDAGIKVTGSDIRDSERLELLRLKGAKVYIGHKPYHIKNQDLVVYSSAIKEDNPELIEARRKNIRIIKRAEALAEIIQNANLITVTGSHGKTTTSSLVSHILMEAGFFPTVVVGGIWLNLNNSAFKGGNDFFVVEADESDGSFLYFKPNYSIITNIDFEHLDYYKNMENLLNTFVDFINNIRQDGYLIACGEDKNILSILKRINKKTVLYGLSSHSDIYAKDIKFEGLSSYFDCIYKGNFLERFYLPLGGLHNVLNSLAAIALARQLKIETQIIKDALSKFKGTRRRIEVKSFIDGVLFIDDYAHHPTEIRATLKTVSNLGYRRVIAIFQPHRYSRTKILLDEFAKCFDDLDDLVDELIITDIYPADESPIEGIDAERLTERINFYKKIPFAKFLSKEKIIPYILDILKKDDLVITLGAGDIYKICDELIQQFKGKGKD